MDVDAYLQKEKCVLLAPKTKYVERECIQVCFVQLLIQPVLSQNLSLSSSSVKHMLILSLFRKVLTLTICLNIISC